jgi:hypothetical protein
LLVAQTGRLGGLETSPGRKSLKTGSKVDDLLASAQTRAHDRVQAALYAQN